MVLKDLKSKSIQRIEIHCFTNELTFDYIKDYPYLFKDNTNLKWVVILREQSAESIWRPDSKQRDYETRVKE